VRRKTPSAVIAATAFAARRSNKMAERGERSPGAVLLLCVRERHRPSFVADSVARTAVFRWINGKDPRQYVLILVCGPVSRCPISPDKFGVKLSLASVGKCLRPELGFTPQKPLMRAYERDPAAIEVWKRDTYRQLRHGPTPWSGIYFWDEAGFRCRCGARRTGASRARRRLLRAWQATTGLAASASMPRRLSGLRHTREG